ncbi:flagellar export protein FliJ [Effusibacillus pohliae]|uniref:flagellar export protein FliJ n=1 Tax=Effusibacillus pohliae TaxID=232270 RepID=UPI0003664B1C|nr:flagellar FliJ family protein [Effusibacillus pohliae]
MSIPMRTIQKIHSIKSLFARQTEWEFAEHRRQLSQAESLLHAIETDLEHSLARFKQIESAGTTPLQLLAWDEWLNSQRCKLQQQKQQCSYLAGQVETTRLRFIHRQRDQEIWQRLKQKRLESRDRDLKKKEQSELDEISLRMRRKAP